MPAVFLKSQYNNSVIPTEVPHQLGVSLSSIVAGRSGGIYFNIFAEGESKI
jgi:hypothetical protein